MTATEAMTAIVTRDSPESDNAAPLAGAGVGQTGRTVPSAHENDDTVIVGCTLASTDTPGVAAAICCASGELGVVAIVANVWASAVSAVPDDGEADIAGSAAINTVR